MEKLVDQTQLTPETANQVETTPVLSLIVPTYNERDNIRTLVTEVTKAFARLDEAAELLIVDDCSPDGTAQQARDTARELGYAHAVRVIVRQNERGLATAVADGIAQARGEIIGIMDADLSHPPHLLGQLLGAIRDGTADIAVASRYVAGGGTEDWPLSRRLISNIARKLARPLTEVRDNTSGFLLLKRSCLDRDALQPRGYKIGLEILARAAHPRVVEVPYTFRDRSRGESKLGHDVVLAYLVQLASLYRARFPLSLGYAQFASVGALGVIVDSAVFALCYWYLGLANLGAVAGGGLAQTGSFVAASLFNFHLNAAWTFRQRRQSAHFPAFLAVSSVGFALRSLVFTSVVVAPQGIAPSLFNSLSRFLPLEQAALLLAVLVASVWNYYGSLRWAFPTIGKASQRRWRWSLRGDIALGWTVLLLIGIVTTRLVFGHQIALSPDEAYYWQWSRHLDWGYYDHPPMIAYLIAAGTGLLGVSELGVRALPMLLSSATVLIIYRLGADFGGSRRAGLLAALFSAVTPLYSIGGLLATPDAPLAFFWVSTIAATLYALRRPNIGTWLLAGVAAGGAMLSKYSALFLVASLFAAMLSTERGRRALRTPGPAAGAGVAALLVLPMLLWNLQRGMASIGFQLTHGLGDGAAPRALSEHLETLGGFVAGQIGVLTPLVAILVAWATVVACRAPATPGERKDRARTFQELQPFLVWPTLLPLACFALASVFSPSEANWPAPAYLSGFTLLGVVLWQHESRMRRRGRFLVWAAVLSAASLSAYIHVEAAWPLLRYEGGPFAKVRDRSEMLQWVQELRETHLEPEAKLLASSYQLASLLAFALPQQPQTDAPFERGSGSAYREWLPHACRSGHAWYFSERLNKPPPDGLFDSFAKVGTFIERRKGISVGTITAYFGEQRRGPDCP